jgi:hypothetical protein
MDEGAGEEVRGGTRLFAGSSFEVSGPDRSAR